VTIKEPDGGLFRGLVPLLTGEHDVWTLTRRLAEFEAPRILAALTWLSERGLLDDAAADCPSWLSDSAFARYQSQLIFFSQFSSMQAGGDFSGPDFNRFDFQKRLSDAKVVVFGVGRLGSNVVNALAHLGVGELLVVDREPVTADDVYSGASFNKQDIGSSRADALKLAVESINPLVSCEIANGPGSADAIVAGADLVVVATDHYDLSLYQHINRECLRENVPWTSVRCLGFELALGPSIIPYETPCFSCFAGRLKSSAPSLEDYSLMEEFLSRSRWTGGHLNIVVGADLMALEVAKILTNLLPRTYAHLFSLHLMTFKSRLDPILKLPTCQDCGAGSRARPPQAIWDEA
jgi:ribosomal protein S12 methylthiotransferase accessory factor